LARYPLRQDTIQVTTASLRFFIPEMKSFGKRDKRRKLDKVSRALKDKNQVLCFCVGIYLFTTYIVVWRDEHSTFLYKCKPTQYRHLMILLKFIRKTFNDIKKERHLFLITDRENGSNIDHIKMVDLLNSCKFNRCP
jgi:hypothetical protein